MLRAECMSVPGTFAVLMSQRMMMTIALNTQESSGWGLCKCLHLKGETEMGDVWGSCGGQRKLGGPLNPNLHPIIIIIIQSLLWLVFTLQAGCMTSVVAFVQRPVRFPIFAYVLINCQSYRRKVNSTETIICLLGKSRVFLKHLPCQCLVTQQVHVAALRRASQVINCKLSSTCILFISS